MNKHLRRFNVLLNMIKKPNFTFLKSLCWVLIFLFSSTSASFAGNGTSGSPFTSLSQAAGITTAGIYYFNINGVAFSTYINSKGWVNVAAEKGQSGVTALPTTTALTSTTDGILSPAALAELSSAVGVALSTSDGVISATTASSTVVGLVATNNTIYTTTTYNWVGTNSAWLNGASSVGCRGATTLATDVIDTCGWPGGVLWYPGYNPPIEVWSSQTYVPTGVNIDLWVIPPTADLTLKKITAGGVGGPFTFGSLTNLTASTSSPSTSITTTVANTATPGTPLNVNTLNSPVSVTETPASGYSISGVSCIDLNSAVTGNTGTFGTLVGSTITIPATNVKSGASFNCTYTNVKSASVSYRKVKSGSGNASTIATTITAATNLVSTPSGTLTSNGTDNNTTGNVTAAVNTSAINTDVTATEAAVAGYTLTAVNCSDSNSALSGNPATFSGTVSGNVATVLAANVLSGAIITCNLVNTATTLQLGKAWGANSKAGNIASIGATSGGTNNTALFTSTVPTAAVSSVAVVSVGNVITIPAETLTTGTLANYNTVVSCTANGGAMASSLSGTNGQVSNTLTVAAGDIGKAIVCTYTNTRKSATLQVTKAWAAGSTSGNVASITATAGGTNNTATFTATAPTGANSGTAVTVSAGDTLTFPAETMTTGSLSNYTTVVSCTGNGNSLSGSNGQASNTLLIGSSDTAVVCTYTNTPKPATVSYRKVKAASGTAATIATTITAATNLASTPSGTLTSATVDGATTGNVTTAVNTNALNTDVTATEGAVAGYTLTAVNCSDSASGTSGNPATFAGTVSGNVATTLAANILAGANITCNLVNSKIPTVAFNKIKTGSGNATTVAAAFTAQTNLASTPATVTSSTTDGTAGTTDAAVNVSTIGTAVTVTETAVPGWTLSSVSCTDSNGTASGNGASAIAGSVSGNVVTIPASAIKAGAVLTCSLTNAEIQPQITVTKALGANGRAIATDQFTTQIKNGASVVNSTTNSTTTGSGSTVTGGSGTTGATTVVAGTAYTLTEIGAGAPVATLSNYTSTLSCTNSLSGSSTVLPTTVGGTVTPQAGDVITCTLTNNPQTATLQLGKAWGANSKAGNIASIGATSGGTNNTALFTSTVPTAAVSSVAVVSVGNVITIPAETLTTGTLANYNTVVSCTANGGAMASSLSGTNGQVSNTLTVAAGDIGKAIVCTYTNTRKSATLQVTKAWAAGSTSGNVASITATAGGTNNTATFTATAPTGANSGTAVTVSAGDTLTFPAETMTTGSLSNYTTVVSCTGNGNSLSGSNGQASNTLLIGSSDTAVVCTYTNTPKPATVKIAKISQGGVATFSFASLSNLNNTTDSVTTTIVGTAATSAQTNTVTTLGTAVAMTESALAGYTLGSATCNDANMASTGNPASFGGLSGNVLTIPATNVVAGANITCTFTNNKAATVAFNKIKTGSGNATTVAAAFTAQTNLASTPATVTSSTTDGTAGTTDAAVNVSTIGTAVTVTETAVPGWTLSSVSCTDSNGTASGNGASAIAGSVSGNVVTIPASAIKAGAVLTCSLTNAEIQPQITVTKALGANGRAIATDQFTTQIKNGASVVNSTTNSTTTGSGSTVTGGSGTTGATTVVAGTAYTLTEIGAGAPVATLSNYTSTLSCTNSLSGSSTVLPTTVGGTVTPQAGDVITCTLTNTAHPATVKIAKVSQKGIGTFAFTNLTNLSNANDSVTTTTMGTAATSAQTNTVTTPGTAVSITETALAGYTLNSVNCTDANAASTGNPASFGGLTGNVLTIPASNVIAGANITCTFTNTAAATVAFNKAKTGSSNNNVLTASFTAQTNLSAIPANLTSSTADGTAGATGATLNVLTMNTPITLTESLTSGWTLASVSCIDANGTTSGNGTTALAGTVSGGVLTIPATTIKAGAALTCTITNTQSGLPITNVRKTSTTISDPVNGTNNPKTIPGAMVQYSIVVQNEGAISPSANTVTLQDTVPANTTLCPPVTFTDAAAGGVTTNLTSPVVTYYDASGTVIASPGTSCNSAIHSFKVTTTGTMALPATAQTPPYPTFSVNFNCQVN